MEVLVVGYVLLAVLLVAVGELLVNLWVPSALGDWDANVNQWLADNRVAWLDHLTRLGTFVADTVPVIAVTLVVAIGFLVARRWREAMLVVAALVVEFTVFLTVNMIVGRDRPDVVRLDSTPSTSSFPSGHIAATIVVWSGLALVVMACTNRRAARAIAWVVALLLAVLVAFARVYRGMHHVTDVLGGAALGIGALVVAVTAVRITGVVVERRSRPATDITTETTEVAT